MAENASQGRSGRNGFAALSLARCAENREDPAWLAAELEHVATRFLPVWGVRNLVAGEPFRAVGLDRQQLGGQIERAESVIFLGRDHHRSWFAVGYGPEDVNLPRALAVHGEFRGLRKIAPLLAAEDAALLAYARAMTTWHRETLFCGVCGHPTESRAGGFVRRCTGEGCGREHFPRTDPAIIVLVHRDDRCLLGRQAAWEPGRHSVIAGYLEPGETFEAAVVREAFEETGVEVAAVTYRSSQPWPFPGSIMVGFSASAETDKITLHDKELESARWFSRDELSQVMKQGVVTLPYRVSIAYQLIEEWFNAADGWRLSDWMAEDPGS